MTKEKMQGKDYTQAYGFTQAIATPPQLKLTLPW